MEDTREEVISEVDAALAALNDRQQKFVELIAAGVPQTEAAKRAGYAHKHAASMASHLRKQPKVARALSALAEVHQEAEQAGGIELVEKRLLEISQTGTPAARVSALSALQRLYESQSRSTGSEALLEQFREMPAEDRLQEIFDRFQRILDRLDEGSRKRHREDALRIRSTIESLYA